MAVIIIKTNQKNENTGQPLEQTEINAEKSNRGPSINGTKYVSEQNGVKVNTSSKLKEIKQYDIYTFSNITIETNTNGSVIQATVKSSLDKKTEGRTIKIKILDDQGEIVAELGGYIGQINPDDSITFKAETSTDITNAYDLIIEQSK